MPELFFDTAGWGHLLDPSQALVVMRERRITEALTTDHHFEQAGFIALLA
jgi:predicted nucleic acid-binding protein